MQAPAQINLHFAFLVPWVNQPGLGVCGNSAFSCLQGSPAVKSVGTILLFDGILFCDIGIDSDPLLRGEHTPPLSVLAIY